MKRSKESGTRGSCHGPAFESESETMYLTNLPGLSEAWPVTKCYVNFSLVDARFRRAVEPGRHTGDHSDQQRHVFTRFKQKRI